MSCEPTEMETRCLRKMRVSDPHIKMLRAVMAELRGPHHTILDQACKGIPIASGDAARLIQQYIDAVSPP